MEKPQRMCIACRQMTDKRDLLRVVRSADGAVSIDDTGKRSGRGAYVCKKADCINKCVKNRLFNKAFKCEVSADFYAELKRYE